MFVAIVKFYATGAGECESQCQRKATDEVCSNEGDPGYVSKDAS